MSFVSSWESNVWISVSIAAISLSWFSMATRFPSSSSYIINIKHSSDSLFKFWTKLKPFLFWDNLSYFLLLCIVWIVQKMKMKRCLPISRPCAYGHFTLLSPSIPASAWIATAQRQGHLHTLADFQSCSRNPWIVSSLIAPHSVTSGPVMRSLNLQVRLLGRGLAAPASTAWGRRIAPLCLTQASST